MTENYDNNNYSNQNSNYNREKGSWTDGNSEMIKFLTTALSAFLGAFLAIALLGRAMLVPATPQMSYPATMKTKQMHNESQYQSTVLNDDELFNQINKDFELMNNRMFTPITTPKFNIVKFEENSDNYKITIDLKQFHDDEKNVIVEVKPNYVKISGKAAVKTKNQQSTFSYMQEMPLSKKIDLDDVKREKIGNNYVITIPIED